MQPASATRPEVPPRRGMMVFCPRRFVPSVTDVDPDDLRARGIVGVILDLDNTLVRWQRLEMDEAVQQWLAAMKAAGLRFCLLSNSIFGKRASTAAELLGCPNVRWARKPGRRGFRLAMEAMGTEPAQTAVIGDQMFTDIWGGNRVGAYTILVAPIHRREFVYTQVVSRPLERMLLHWFRRGGRL